MGLLELCNEAVLKPEFQPSDGVTHCNQAADFIAFGMGCRDLRDVEGNVLMADPIIWKLRGNPNWREVTLGGTWNLANQGALIFGVLTSSQLGEEHGHIATVIPGRPIYSGHWENLSPLCANVGKENFIGRPMSYAFRTMPEFYGWIPSMPKEVILGVV